MTILLFSEHTKAMDKVQRKADAISDAAHTLADLLNREVSLDEMIAAALREAINQCQVGLNQCQVGWVCIPAPELLSIAQRLAGRPSSSSENI